MKRYPKRARPLWGSPPRVPFAQVARRAWARRCAVETASAAYWMSGDALFTLPSMPIAFSYALDPVTPRPGVLTFTTDGATPIEESLTAGDVVLAINSPGGTVEEFKRSVADLARRNAPLALGGPIVTHAIEVANRVEEERVKQRIREMAESGEHEVTVTATVTGDMVHTHAEYVPTHIERVQFFEALREMTIDPGTVLVLPPCEIKVDT